MKKSYTLTLFLGLIFLALSGPVRGQEATRDSIRKQARQEVFNKIKENFKIGGFIDAQYRFDQEDEKRSSVMQIRRARLDLKGSLSTWVDFRLQADFAGTPKLLDAFVKVNFCKYVKLQIGQFKIPFSIENPYSPLDLEFSDNAQVISALSGYKDISGVSSYVNSREIGAMLTGTLFEANMGEEKLPILQYSVGIFGGNGINVKSDNMAKDLAARIDICPYIKHLTLSASGYWGKYDMPYEGKSVNTDGLRIRYTGGAEYKDDRLTIRGEYVWGRTDFAQENQIDSVTTTYTPNPMNTHGFYVVAGYWFKFGWGKNSSIQQKLRPVLRFDYYERDIAAGQTSLNYSAGIGWWPEKHVRIQIDYTLRQTLHKATFGHMLTAIASVKF